MVTNHRYDRACPVTYFLALLMERYLPLTPHSLLHRLICSHDLSLHRCRRAYRWASLGTLSVMG